MANEEWEDSVGLNPFADRGRSATRVESAKATPHSIDDPIRVPHPLSTPRGRTHHRQRQDRGVDDDEAPPPLTLAKRETNSINGTTCSSTTQAHSSRRSKYSKSTRGNRDEPTMTGLAIASQAADPAASLTMAVATRVPLASRSCPGSVRIDQE